MLVGLRAQAKGLVLLADLLVRLVLLVVLLVLLGLLALARLALVLGRRAARGAPCPEWLCNMAGGGGLAAAGCGGNGQGEAPPKAGDTMAGPGAGPRISAARPVSRAR